MKRLVGTLFILAALSVAWTDAHAKVLFNSTVVCDTDGDNVFGGPSDGTGRIQLMPQGVVKLLMSGLPPGAQASCLVFCVGSNSNVVVDMACGTANASGKISFTSRRAAFDPTVGCFAPLAVVQLSDGHTCAAGWGTGALP